MKDIEVHILKAFVQNGEGGNPAGVVLDADNFSTEQKARIAAKVGLSETAFLSKSSLADFKIDFFTPARQIAHCGHATIATFSYLSQIGKITSLHSSKETIDGRREIYLKEGEAYMEQRSPIYTTVEESFENLLASVNLQPSDLIKDAPILIVNTGNSFAIFPVKNRQVLREVRPDFPAITHLSKEFNLIGYYLFCLSEESENCDAETRMFAPYYGIEEEAATGMAAGPLACYLYDVLTSKKEHFRVQQGVYMNPPSPSLIKINLEIKNERIERVFTGGLGIHTKTLHLNGDDIY